MPSIHLHIPHQLPKEEALERIQSLIQRVKNQFGDKVTDVQEEWHGDTGRFSFSIMGFDVSGKLNVSNSTVGLDGKIPMAAALFRGKIKSVIMEEAQKVLN
jgi:hypothetical protein